MIKKYLWIIMFFGIYLYAKPTPLSEHHSFLIVWWNVENFFDPVHDDGKQDTEFTPNGNKHWTEDRLQKKFQNLSHVISDISTHHEKKIPDIMGFAEVEHETLLHSLYKQYLNATDYQIIYHETADIRGIDVGIVFNPNVFSLIEKKIIPVSSHHHPLRDILMGKFKSNLQSDFKSNNNILYVFAMHWSSRRGGIQSTESKRITYAKTLRKEINIILQKNPDADILIMGDLNDEPFNISLVQYLKTTGDISKTIGSNEYLYDFLSNYSDVGTAMYQKDWLKIDHFIASKGLFDQKEFHTSQDQFKVFSPEYLFTTPIKRKKKIKLNRTYDGLIYQGGYSDHLPIILNIED